MISAALNVLDPPAIVKILAVFAGILLLTRMRMPLGAAVVFGGVGIDLWSGRTPGQVLFDVLGALSTLELWLFVIVTALIMDLGRFLANPEQSAVLLGAIQRWGGQHGRAWGLMAMPSVIGLIPMPAGALVSAPLVAQASIGTSRDEAWQTAVNYWFRHTWEYWWPLYPGVIVAMSVLPVTVWQFVAAQAVCTPLALAAGWFFIVRPHRDELACVAPAPPAPAGSLALVILPLGLMVACAFLLPPVVSYLSPAMASANQKLAAMLLGAMAALLTIVIIERRRGQRHNFWKLFEKQALATSLTVGGVMFFKGLLDRSGILSLACSDLMQSGIPPAVAVAALPLLAGLVTGIAVGFAGVSMPLVAGLMVQPGAGLSPMATVALAYGFGYVGMMLTPLHLCLAMSRDYFHAPWGAIYRNFLPCLAVVAAYAILAFSLYSALGW
ncbi:MAG: DUF401 family protein [bacterium]